MALKTSLHTFDFASAKNALLNAVAVDFNLTPEPVAPVIASLCVLKI